LVIPFTAGADFRPDNTSASLRFAFSHTLSDRFSLGYNLGAEWDGFSTVPDYFYSIALGAGVTDRLGVFAESYGTIPEEGIGEHLLDTGITYLGLKNFQLDISGGIGIVKAAVDNFISIGLTYRIPE
jgi:hypothetical protein